MQDPRTLAGAALLLALVCGVPLWRALSEGGHCMGRYPHFWKIPWLFGFAYALFQATLQVLVPVLYGGVDAVLLPFEWQFPQNVALPWYATLDSVAGIFGAVTPAFPLAAIFAFAFLTGWRDLRGHLWVSLRKRLPRAGWICFVGILLAGFACVLKPVTFALLPDSA